MSTPEECMDRAAGMIVAEEQKLLCDCQADAESEVWVRPMPELHCDVQCCNCLQKTSRSLGGRQLMIWGPLNMITVIACRFCAERAFPIRKDQAFPVDKRKAPDGAAIPPGLDFPD